MNETLTAPARKTGLIKLMAGFFGVQLFVNLANGGVANSLLPNAIAQLEPEAKVAILGTAGALAAVGALITQPLWGMLSDRTRSRFGRRVPWIVGGIAGLALAFLGFAAASSVVVVVLLAAAVQIFYSMVAAPLSAIVPDRTPESRRGIFSALGALGVFIGGLIGVAVASQFVLNLPAGYLVMTVVLLVGAVPFVLALRERRADVETAPVERTSFSQTIRTFFVDPRKHPDFFWAFIARLVLMVGYWSIVSFQLYILDDYIGLGLVGANQVFPLVTAALGIGIIVALVPSGALSDRVGRRKPFVIVSSLVVALSAVIPIFAPTLIGVFVSIGLGGLGFGVYLAVDQALMTQVLPNKADAGKDLGVLNIAQAGGQVIAPLVASLVIGLGGYPALYATAAVLAVVAALAILPIKSVR